MIENPAPQPVPWQGNFIDTCNFALTNFNALGKPLAVSLPHDVEEDCLITGLVSGSGGAGSLSGGFPTNGGLLAIYGNGFSISSPNLNSPITVSGGARIILNNINLIAPENGCGLFVQNQSYVGIGQNVKFVGQKSQALAHAEYFSAIEVYGENGNTLILEGDAKCGFWISDSAALELDPSSGLKIVGPNFHLSDPSAYGAGLFQVLSGGKVLAIHVDVSLLPGMGQPLWFVQGGGSDLRISVDDFLASGWVKGFDPTFGGNVGNY